jgi:hypothetical protein
MANTSPGVATASPLQELQKAFCLLRLSGDVLIAEQCQIEAVRNGTDREGVQMFRMTPGKLLVRRHLEALPLASLQRQATSPNSGLKSKALSCASYTRR